MGGGSDGERDALESRALRFFSTGAAAAHAFEAPPAGVAAAAATAAAATAAAPALLPKAAQLAG